MTYRLAQAGPLAFLITVPWVSMAGGPDDSEFSAASRMFSPPVTRNEVQSHVDASLYYGAYSRFHSFEVPAFHDIAPKLGLSYDSLSTGRYIGVGWAITGFSTIRRDLPENASGIERFRLDDAKLVPCSEVTPRDHRPSSSCATGGTHTTRTESYRRIRFDEEAATWTVWDKDGTQTTYTPIASRELNGRHTYTVFGVESIVDTNDNEVSFSWLSYSTPHGGLAYPRLVEYNHAHPTRIQFLYGSRPDPLHTADGYVDKRLDAVQITVDGTMLRGYKMAYATSDATGRSLLATIKEYGRDAELLRDAQDDEYHFTGRPKDSPAVFSYESQAHAEPWNRWTDAHSLPILHDLSTPSGCMENGVRPIDLNGDGFVDFLRLWKLRDGTQQMSGWLNTGTRFAPAPEVYWTVLDGGTPLPAFFRVGCGDQGVRIADLNGDGLQDMVQALEQTNYGGEPYHYGAWLNTGRGWREDSTYRVPQRERAYEDSLYFTRTMCDTYCNGWPKDNGLRIFDINGDGRADLSHRMRYRATATNPTYSEIIETLFNVDPGPDNTAVSSAWLQDSDGTTYGMDLVPFYTSQSTAEGGDQGVTFLDLNGDGLTDILQSVYFDDPQCHLVTRDCPHAYTSHGVVKALINTGSEFIEAPEFSTFEEDPTAAPFVGSIPFLVDHERLGDGGVRVADLNGDGRSDIIQKFRGFFCAYHDLPPHTIERAWLSTGSGWKRDDSWASRLPFFADVAYTDGTHHGVGTPAAYWKTGTTLVDINGDGATDVIQGFDGYYNDDHVMRRRVWLNKLRHRDLAKSVTTEAGSREDISYEPSTTWPNGRSITVVPTVSSIARAEYPDADAQYVTEYSYEGAAFDPVDRVFNGFERAFELLPPITSGNAGDRPYREIVFRQTIPSRGKVWMISLIDSEGRRLWHQTRLHEESIDGFPYTSLETQRLTYRYGNNGEEVLHRVGMTYDDYGSVATFTDFGAATDDPFTSAAFYEYDASRFIVDRVKQRDTYTRNGGELLRRSLYFYDPHGNLRHHYRYAGDDLFVGRHFEYFDNGKLKVFTDELGRHTRYVRDDGYYANEIRNPLYETDARQRNIQKWDTVCGKLEESTDGNNLTTITKYDNFCRLHEIVNPAGDTEVIRYWKNPSSGLGITTYIDNGADDEQWKAEEFDGFGQLRETKREGPNDTSEEDEIFDLWRQYDGHGRVVAEARPHYCGERSSYKAGPDDRLVTRMYYDALGRPTRTILPDGNERTWDYDALTTTMTDERGAKTRTVADVWGRVVESSRWIDDAWHSVYFEYDEVGQLRNLTDEEGNIATYGHDLLGRQTYVFHPDAGERTFRYDAAGQLYEIEDTTGQVTRTTHDALGRPLCVETAYGTDAAERYCQFYDWHRDGYYNVGRVTTETFGGNVHVLNYDKAGNVVYSLVANGQSHLTTRSYDAWSRLLGTTYPDGDTLGTNKDPIEYDDAGRLMRIPGVVDALEYTADGRPVRRADASGVDVRNEYSPTRGFLELQEVSGYGRVLHRLSYTHKENGFVDSVSSTASSHEWDYDYDEAGRLNYVAHDGKDWVYRYSPMGNLTYNGDTGQTYVYPPPGGPRPHAVEAIGNDTYSYDGNGNLLSGGGRQLIWDASGRLVASNGARFGYGADRNRYFKSENGVNTFYFAGGVEYSKGKYTKYITAGDAGLAAKRVGTATTWLYTDHLGSVVGVGDANGNIDVQAFRPYGQPDVAVDGERVGFTGQRHDLTGLIYLNDRYYDPITTRFVAADRHFLRDSEETQRSPIEAVNAYQYALNNPVNNTDPTGKLACGGACITAVVTLLSPLVLKIVESITTSDGSGPGGGGSASGIGEDGGGEPEPEADASGAGAMDGGGGPPTINNPKIDDLGRPIEKNPKAPTKFTKEMASKSEVIAKGGRIKKADKLVEKFGGKTKNWVKKKTWDAAGNEIHYYEHPGIGRVGAKPKGAPDPF